MSSTIRNFNEEVTKSNKTGLRLFNIGVFLLPTAPFISSFIFIISLLFSKNNNPILFVKDKTNKVFIIISLLMTFSCIYNYFDSTNLLNKKLGYLPLISLVNWIPFFYCFWGFQPYLENRKTRERVAKLLVVGSIPVIFSGFLQYFFDVTGPFEILNGLIIWYQRPLSITDGLTGPFNNANYAGSWLAIVWPFSVYCFISNKKISKKVITTIICLLFLVSIMLTNSRNSWIGMFISVQIIFGFETMFLVIPILIILFFILTLCISLVPLETKDFFVNSLPINIFNNFPDNSISLNAAFPRLEIWKFSIENILNRPILGWGGGSFPILHETFKDKWFGHPHNIIFEIAINYGLLTAFIISSTIFKYLLRFYKTIKCRSELKINREKYNLVFDKAWFSSILFITYSHLFDIQYFDLRISIVCWILLSGLKASMI